MDDATKINTNAFAHLLNLEERVRLSGASLPKVTDTREQFSGIKCRIADTNFIVPMDDVAEILENRVLTSIPGCAEWVKGVLNLRGRLLPIYAVPEFFGNPEEGHTGPYQLIVVEKGALFCGIQVNRIYGMQKFYQDEFSEFRRASGGYIGKIADYVDYEARIEEHRWYRLNIEALVTQIVGSSPEKTSKKNMQSVNAV